MQRYDILDKKILDFILEKDIPYEKIEAVFYELYLINPYSSDVSLSDLTFYPNIYFHSDNVYHEMVTAFETLLTSNEEFIARKRFRAFLALIYLKGMKEKGFYGYKKLLEVEQNQRLFDYAYEVYTSEEDFKFTFCRYDSLLAQEDTIRSEKDSVKSKKI